MAGTRKMVDAAEVRTWIEEGRTYRWMVEEYERKYNLHVSASMFSEFRAVNGLARRTVRDPDLIPWRVAPHHRWDNMLANLRTEARLRAGEKLEDMPYPQRVRYEAFRRQLEEGDLVVYYDGETEDGFFLVPREPQDTDIIRRPNMPSKRGRGVRD